MNASRSAGSSTSCHRAPKGARERVELGTDRPRQRGAAGPQAGLARAPGAVRVKALGRDLRHANIAEHPYVRAALVLLTLERAVAHVRRRSLPREVLARVGAEAWDRGAAGAAGAVGLIGALLAAAARAARRPR